MPFTGGTSAGDGMYSMTASSIAWTPLFLNAEPHSMMQISTRIERSRRPALISSTVSSPVSRYLCISVSLASAAASTSFSRHSLHSSSMSAGISRYSNFMPSVLSSQ